MADCGQGQPTWSQQGTVEWAKRVSEGGTRRGLVSGEFTWLESRPSKSAIALAVTKRDPAVMLAGGASLFRDMSRPDSFVVPFLTLSPTQEAPPSSTSAKLPLLDSTQLSLS